MADLRTDVIGRLSPGSACSQILLHFGDRARNGISFTLSLWSQISGLDEFRDHLARTTLIERQRSDLSHLVSLIKLVERAVSGSSKPY